MTKLKHLQESDVTAIIEAAENHNTAHPPSDLGITLEEGRKKLRQPNPTRDKLMGLLKSLSDEARYELVALMWLGRGDVQATFAQHLTHAQKNSDPGDAAYIAEKSPALPTYLRAGLEHLKSD